MARALELARRGTALASPNPMVGCVIVRGDRVVGEGFHTYEGKKHAEIAALEQAGSLARGATLYVNLEPCCHAGRTGPCSRAIIAAGLRRVVAAMRDPNPRVAGGGFRELRRAGIEVVAGVREDEARRVNDAFAKWIRTRLPLVTLKSALTLDGQIAVARGRATAITCVESLEEVQGMRQGADALLTGIGTVLTDDPLLTDRTGLPRRRPLLRVVVDSKLRLPLRSRLVRSAKGDVLVLTTVSSDTPKGRALRRAGIEVVQIAMRRGEGGHGRDGRVDLRAAIAELGRREILSVLLEAGSELNGGALAAGIVDRMTLFYAPKILGTDEVPFVRWPKAARSMARVTPVVLQNATVRRIGTDFAVEGTIHDVYGHHRSRGEN
jgi:diaminohydroxyphosphoribosylaminopyrimidine deaminase/5-amino-6-(5-phosphoribosylamino)uracil reductase